MQAIYFLRLIFDARDFISDKLIPILILFILHILTKRRFYIEIILYVYSYCGGSHFGNDYGMINDINKIRKNNKLLQITEHNKDYVFNIELKDIQFQKPQKETTLR